MADKKTKKEEVKKEEPQKKKSGKKEAGEVSAKQQKEVRVPVRLLHLYKENIAPDLQKKFKYKSIMQVPKIHKIVVNMGVGAAVAEPKILEEA
ncbi:MAG TPA: 50S ribosomal protein L5, partial [Ignavibacteriaceae bacterium]|nr:50S ribosomal protein L5 [Ignavibacteriaceae bacterium]